MTNIMSTTITGFTSNTKEMKEIDNSVFLDSRTDRHGGSFTELKYSNPSNENDKFTQD